MQMLALGAAIFFIRIRHLRTGAGGGTAKKDTEYGVKVPCRTWGRASGRTG